MTRKTISAWEARRQFGRVLRDVSTRGVTFVVMSHGEPIAEVVPLAKEDGTAEARRELFAIMRRAGERSNLAEADAERLALEAVEAVRTEHAKQ